jgi:predicted MFS family arabinose efflux permease
VGPSIAGIFIAQVGERRPHQKAFGEGMCFLLDTLTFLAVLYSLFRIKTVPAHTRPEKGKRLLYLTDGLRFVKKQRHVKALMVHLMVMALFGIPYLMIMPVYAREVLNGGAEAYGSLMTAVGVGAVFGGIVMTRRESVKGLGSHMSKSVFGFVIMLVLLAINSHYVMALILLGIAGFFMVMAMIGSQTLVQTALPEDIRGRVMSIYGMISVGFLPFGSLLSGAIAEQYGVRMTLLINAGVCALATAYFTLKLPELRAAALATPEYRAAVGED